MTDREAALAELAISIAEPVSKLLTELERLLVGLGAVQHFDLTDPSTLGSAIHSALPSAIVAAHLHDLGWDIKTAVGPGNKLICKAPGDGALREAVIEVHLAGPRGGVSKSRHQFAAAAAEGTPGYLPGFEIEAPASALMFLGLYPDAAFTRISAAYLMYADGVDKRCVKLELPRGVATGEHKDSELVEAKKLPSSKVKIKETAPEKRDAGSKNKRGDGSSSA
jgi:hypothetical protein